MLGHLNQERHITLLMVLIEVYGEEVDGPHKNLLVLDLQHKATFMAIRMNESVLTQNLIGFLKALKTPKLVILVLVAMVLLVSN